MKSAKIHVNGLKPKINEITVLLLLTAICACGARAYAGGDSGVSEEQLATNNVWHAAKLRGIAFRAIGQEPAWLLEIKDGEEILVVTDYGQNKKSYPYVEPQQDKAARKTVFQIDADTSVLIEGKPCSDTMSGEKFQTTVTLKTAAKTLKGCGRALF